MSNSAKQHLLAIHSDAFCVRYDPVAKCSVIYILGDGCDGHVYNELGRGTSRRLAWEAALSNTLAKAITA